MAENFLSLTDNPYFVDKTSFLTIVFSETTNNNLITFPRRWGKTTNMSMLECFTSIRRDRFGKEIINNSFEEFSDKKVVTEDVVEVEDISFLYQNIRQVKDQELNNKCVKEVFRYFKKKKYPWFLMKRDIDEEKQSVIMRIYNIVSRALPNEDEYKFKTKEELKQILEEKIEELKNIQEDNQYRYFNILSHFGKTCKHFAKYPVIFITLPEIKKLAKGKSELIILQSIQSLYMDHSYLRDSYYDQIDNPTVETNILKNAQDNLEIFNQYVKLQISLDRSLLFLSQQLFKLTQVPAIILIDEYDKPMHSSRRFGEDHYEEVKSLMSAFMANSLKNNPNIDRSYTTGVSRLSKADIFSGLNNLIEYGLENTIFQTCFGFTQDEVKSLIAKYYKINPPEINISLDKTQQDIDLKKIKEETYNSLKYWYNKYRIRDIDLFNPFSVMSCLQKKLEYECYWANSGSPHIFLESFKNIKDKEGTLKLLQQETIIFELMTSLDWQGMNGTTPSFLLNLLFQSGYLTSAPAEDQPQDKLLRSFVIPNQEVYILFWKYLFPAFFQMTYCPGTTEFVVKKLVQSITLEEFPSLLEKFINEHVEIDPSMKERSYQGLIEAIFRLSKDSKHISQSEKMINGKFADTIFILKTESINSIVLHEYKRVQEPHLVQEYLENASWQIFSLGCTQILLNDEQSWEKAIIRSMAFQTEEDSTKMGKLKTNIFSLEYVFSKEELKSAVDLFSKEQNSNVNYELLRGKGNKDRVKEERQMFLQSKQVKKFNDLLKVPCKTYQQGLLSKEEDIKRASSQVNSNSKGKATKITDFFDFQKNTRSSSRSQLFKEELIKEKNVKEFESYNDSDVSKREYYEDNYERKQEQKSKDQKKNKQKRKRKEEEDEEEGELQEDGEEEDDIEKENDDEQSYQKKESKQQYDQINGKKIRIHDVEKEDETESGNELQNQKLIPKEIYCLPQTEILSWQFKSKILKELSDKKHIYKYSGYAQIYNLYSHSNDRVNLDSLTNYIDNQLNNPEQVDFFSKLLPFIAQLAYEIQNIKDIPFLMASIEAEVIFTRKQIASLLAGMFLGVLLPQQQRDLPSESSFRKILARSLDYSDSTKIQKISCILNYFKGIQAATEEQLNEKVSFHRLVFNPLLHKNSNTSVFWGSSQKQLSKVIPSKEASIEDQDETIQVDFANEFIGNQKHMFRLLVNYFEQLDLFENLFVCNFKGGGVLDNGLGQEEIRFSVSPELIISGLFCPKIEEHEALLIVGSKQFSSYEGYGDTFKFSGNKVEKQVGTNIQGFRKSAVLAIDAINYSQSKNKKEQYQMKAIVRELLKSYVGFECSKQLLSIEGQTKMSICTGRWGCGIFGGDPQLKFLIQWMSASEAERGMIFCSFNDEELPEIERVVELLKNKKVSEVFAMIHKYTELVNKSNEEQTLFQFAKKYCAN